MFRGRMDLLGWKDAPRATLGQWDDFARFADAARRDGLTHTVVCGMGGSSLAPQVFAASFGESRLAVLDSTDPAGPRGPLPRERRFRAVFPPPPDVGGRYAALTVVGMLPAALAGIDGRVLLERALAVRSEERRVGKECRSR